MATQGKRAKPKPKNRVDYDYPIPPPVPVAVVVHRRIGEEIMGWVAACVLVIFLLPLAAMLYLDVLETKAEVKAQVEKVERMRKDYERQKRNDRPESFGDNPVFDRTRNRLKDKE